MSEKTFAGHLPLAYVGVVTALLLALVTEHAARGPAGLPGAMACALPAGFGLEFLWSAWPRHCRDERALPR